MGKAPQLSFVIPVYNKTAKTFEKCLMSLLDMSFKDIEIITVFDGPNPELEAIAEKFKTIIKVIEHGGACKARNEGFRLSKGRYVSFWDADCFAVPQMAKMWMECFERNPWADFVYSGYRFENEQGGYDSEDFDAYSLDCGNFIASMFPIKREICPEWDESLPAAQDWDFWLTVADNGHKGFFLRGYGFSTEKPSRGSISFENWSTEKREETIRRVKRKHNIPDRRIAVCSERYYLKALHLAKLLDADLLKDTGEAPGKYDLILNIGYSMLIRFPGAKKDCVKVNFWMPWDLDALYQIAFKTSRETVRLANLEITHNLCNDLNSKKKMEDLGIKDPNIFPLPTETEDLETQLPQEYRVLVDCDSAYMPVLKDLKNDVPYIPIEFLESYADIKQYSTLLSFHEHPTIDEGLRRFLLNGRHILSNLEEPYCGFVDAQKPYADFKNELIERIRQLRHEPFNKKAQEFYKGIVDPALFRKRIDSLLPKPVLEVVS